MLKPIHLKEGLRMFRRNINVRLKGMRRYDGNAEKICKQIIKDCWNGAYLQVSNGHFCEFYTRDFGFCCESLLKTGYKKEVESSLRYALDIFTKNKRVTVAISPNGKVFNFPNYYAVDSLPYLIRSLRLNNNKSLIENNLFFLNERVNGFMNIVIDKDTGLVRKDKVFSSMKDHSKRSSSCYDNVMVAMLNNELKKIKIIDNPLKDYNFKKIIKENFWQDGYFLDDTSGEKYVAGDANVFPFWTGVFEETNMLKSAITAIQDNDLDKPFPIKYTSSSVKEPAHIGAEIFAKDYERDSIWLHMGPLYVKIVKKVDRKKAAEYTELYRRLIEKHKNFLEVFDKDGKPFKSPFYYTDESMLWSSMFLDLVK
jgi:hypothetical protein